VHADIPIYPYGPARWYKQSNFGLYGSSRIRFGNNVSSRTETKTRRKWRPNIQHKRLWSVALSRFVQVKIATRVLRTIDKVGGLDEYLLGEKAGRIKDLGMKGWELRWRIMSSVWYKKRRELERGKLGLVRMDREEEAELERLKAMLVGRDGALVTEAELEKQLKAYDAENGAEEIAIGEEAESGSQLVADEPPSLKPELRI
jgi:large subunit ribosomal protein L28